MTTDAPARPEPVSQPESDRYWEGAKNGEFWLQRDKATGEYQFYPASVQLGDAGRRVGVGEGVGQRDVAHLWDRACASASGIHG